MIYLIVTLSIVFAGLAAGSAVLLGRYFLHKRYKRFVAENSECLRALKEINSRFSFFPYVDFNQSHTYDNENFYETISCEDFLIYQLQYQAKKIGEQIEKVAFNQTEYRKYLNEIKTLRLGIFSSPFGKLKREKVLKTEKKLCCKAKLAPPDTQFSLKVTLFCSRINGRIYASKEEPFSADRILTLIKRMSYKSGTYFRDRAIWDAICRVERGRVSNKMRFSIYARDGYRCRKCGVSQRFAVLEIDHIIPVSKGGKSTYENLQTLCHKCNVEKGNKI